MYIISTGWANHYIPIILLILGFALIIYPFLNRSSEIETIWAIILGILFIIFSIIFFCTTHNYIIFELGNSYLKITKNKSCSHKITVYNPGDLISVLFIVEFSKMGRYEKSDNHFIPELMLRDKTEKLFEIKGQHDDFTSKEFDYFNKCIKEHIYLRMKGTN